MHKATWHCSANPVQSHLALLVAVACKLGSAGILLAFLCYIPGGVATRSLLVLTDPDHTDQEILSRCVAAVQRQGNVRSWQGRQCLGSPVQRRLLNRSSL